MKKPSWPAFLLIAALASVAILLAVPFVRLVLTVSTTNHNKATLTKAIEAKYPDVRFHVGRQTTTPDLWVIVRNVRDPDTRAEVREWLAGWKVQRGLDARIVLVFLRQEPEDLPERFEL